MMTADSDLLQRYRREKSQDAFAELVRRHLDLVYSAALRQQMSMSGGGGGSWNKVERAVELAAGSYSADHAGQLPTDPSQIASYLNSPVDAATVQKYLAQMSADPPPPEVVPLMSALRAYANDHNGQYPDAPSGLQSYVTTDQEKAALARAMQIYAASHPSHN